MPQGFKNNFSGERRERGKNQYNHIKCTHWLQKHPAFRNGTKYGPGQIAQLVRASSQYAKTADSIPGQGTYKNT